MCETFDQHCISRKILSKPMSSSLQWPGATWRLTSFWSSINTWAWLCINHKAFLCLIWYWLEITLEMWWSDTLLCHEIQSDQFLNAMGKYGMTLEWRNNRVKPSEITLSEGISSLCCIIDKMAEEVHSAFHWIVTFFIYGILMVLVYQIWLRGWYTLEWAHYEKSGAKTAV